MFRIWSRRRLSALVAVFVAVIGVWCTAGVVTAASPPADPVRVSLDGEEMHFDVPAQVIAGRTFVPFRRIFEALGANVGWEPETRTVTAERGRDTVKMTIDSRIVEWRGSLIRLDVPPQIVDGRTLVPLRFIGQALGVKVGWDASSRTVLLETRPGDSLLARGIAIVHDKSCMVCHTFGGAGGNVGPVLDGVTGRYSDEWLRTWLRDPQKVRPGARMPNFGFKDDEIEAVLRFLKYLPD